LVNRRLLGLGTLTHRVADESESIFDAEFCVDVLTVLFDGSSANPRMFGDFAV